MKLFAALLLMSLPVAASAQGTDAAATPEEHTSTISVHSNLVLVPALVKTRSGQLVYTLGVNEFALTDDGVPQKLHLEEDTGGEPLAMVVLVETGSDGAKKLNQYTQLGALLDAVVGAVPHKIAVVGFDSAPQVAQPFTPSLDVANTAIENLEAGDNQDAILDALSFSVEMLRKQPVQYRRAILLISETVDHGSHTQLEDALRAIGDTNTAIYSVAFSSTRAESRHELSKLSTDEPGPEHGCFSRDPNADPRTTPSRGEQDYDCFSELLPPLRLAKMAFLAATNAMRRNVPESVAHITGGEYFHFKDPKSLNGDLLTISNHMPNRYVLSFQPTSPTPGFHAIELKLPDHADLTVDARNGYWVEGEAPAAVAPPAKP